MDQKIKRISISDIKNKKGRAPITCLTAYSFPIAKILDNHCDIILVGDTLGMVVYGMENTRSVTVDMMINHGKAVVKASKKSLIVVDLPYGSYEKSQEQALETARKIMIETSCDAVKLETPSNLISTVEFLVKNNIPVMGHVGLMPQHVTTPKGYKYQGRTLEQRHEIFEDAIKIEQAGAFAIVVEGVVENLAKKITTKLSIPVIGIGASAKCDGQILVIDDMLGLYQEFKPRFVKNYINLAEIIDKATEQYCCEVHSRQFPGKEHCFDV